MKKDASSMKVYHLKRFDHANASFTAGIQNWRKGDAQAEHLHDCVEIMYIVSGSGINYIDHVPHPIVFGDCYIIKQGQTHSFYADADLKFYNLMFDPRKFTRQELKLFRQADAACDVFHSGRKEMTTSRLLLLPPVFEEVLELFQQIEKKLKKPTPLTLLEAKAHLIQLLCKIFLFRQNGIMQGVTTNPDDQLARIMNYVNANYLNDLTLPKIAENTHVAVTYIGELFLNKTGTTLIKYITTLRINRARRLLLHTGRDVTDIARECGFADACYFARIFRKYTGSSPSQYRNDSIEKRKI